MKKIYCLHVLLIYNVLPQEALKIHNYNHSITGDTITTE